MSKDKYVVWWENNRQPDDPDFEVGIERVEAESEANARDVARKQVQAKYQWVDITINRVSLVENAEQ